MMKINPKIRSSILSIISNAFLIIFKLIIGFVTNSVSVISDGIHSCIDLGTAVLTTFTIERASLPPDKKYNYGYQKIESVGSLLQGLFICITGILIVAVAINKIMNPVSAITHLGLAIGIMIASSIINLTVSMYLKEMAEQYNSTALMAESKHRLSDFYSSSSLFVGLFLVWLTHFALLDQIISIGIGILICYESLDILKQSLNSLLDHSLPQKELDVIANILNKYKDSYNNYYDLKTRKNGNKRYIEMKLNVNGSFTMSKVSTLCHYIEKDINNILKDTDVLIQVKSNQNKVSYSNKKNKLKMKIIYKNY